VNPDASAVLVALSDPTRESIVHMLLDEELSVGEIASRLPVSRPAVSKHLRVLEGAALVACRSEGTRNVYGIRPEALGTLRDELDRMWTSALARYALVAARSRPKGGR
jgi:DNA-binding transcriptional ArsR family regulator